MPCSRWVVLSDVTCCHCVRVPSVHTNDRCFSVVQQLPCLLNPYQSSTVHWQVAPRGKVKPAAAAALGGVTIGKTQRPSMLATVPDSAFIAQDTASRTKRAASVQRGMARRRISRR